MKLKILAASVSIYIVWGSAYLAMKLALATIPPLLLASIRLLVAGTLMAGFGYLTGHRPQRGEARGILITAVFLFLGGHGFLYWGQARVPSGLGAVLFATIPLWMVLIEGLSPHGIHLNHRSIGGLALGTCGILLLVGPTELLGSGRVDIPGALAITIAALSWAVGSIYCTRARLPSSAALAGGLEMFTGGVYLIVVVLLSGESRGFHWSQVSRASFEAMAYLALVSSMVGFGCYLWLLKVASPARVSTYAYVTPLVAVGLGWGFNGEQITWRIVGAIALLLTAVVLIVLTRSKRPQPLASSA